MRCFSPCPSLVPRVSVTQSWHCQHVYSWLLFVRLHPCVVAKQTEANGMNIDWQIFDSLRWESLPAHMANVAAATQWSPWSSWGPPRELIIWLLELDFPKDKHEQGSNELNAMWPATRHDSVCPFYMVGSVDTAGGCYDIISIGRATVFVMLCVASMQSLRGYRGEIGFVAHVPLELLRMKTTCC